MNDDMWINVVKNKDDEIKYLRELLIRIKDIVGKGRQCCYCGTESPHAKACDEAMGILDKGDK